MLAQRERSLNDAKPLWGLRVAQLSFGDVQYGIRIGKYQSMKKVRRHRLDAFRRRGA
jgi:hypothetical protein